MKTPREYCKDFVTATAAKLSEADLLLLDEVWAACQREAIEAAARVADQRAKELFALGGVHVRESCGIGETAILIRRLLPPATAPDDGKAMKRGAR